MSTLYEIPGFEKKYVVAQSAKTKGSLPWVAVPTKHDGLSFRRLMRRKDGCELYGVWILLIAVAGKCPRKGVLSDGDVPLTAEDIALKTGASEATILRALEVFSSKEIAWLTTTTLPTSYQDATTAIPPNDHNATPTVRNDTVRNDTVRNDTVRNDTVRNDTVRNDTLAAAGAADSATTFAEFWNVYPRRVKKPAAMRAWRSAVKKAAPDVILAAAREFAASDQGRAGKFCPHPSTWLNDERWTEARAEWSQNGGEQNGRAVKPGIDLSWMTESDGVR